MIDIANPRLEDFARAGGLTPATTPAYAYPKEYRGWSISPGYIGWDATHPDYDPTPVHLYDGPSDNRYVNARTIPELYAEIDAWFAEHCETCSGHGLVTYAIDDCGPCPDCNPTPDHRETAGERP